MHGHRRSPEMAHESKIFLILDGFSPFQYMMGVSYDDVYIPRLLIFRRQLLRARYIIDITPKDTHSLFC